MNVPEPKKPTKAQTGGKAVPEHIAEMLSADPSAVYDPVGDYPERPFKDAMSPQEKARRAAAEKAGPAS